MPLSRAVPFLFVALGLVLSGCIAGDDPKEEILDPPPIDADPNVIAEDGRDLRVDLREDDVISGADWAVGDWFGVHVFFGPGDTTGTHFNTVIVEDKGGNWFLAPDNQQAAKDHAVWDIPIFGDIEKKHLTMGGFGGSWKLYDFPLQHEKTWTSKITVPSFDSFDSFDYDVTFTAKYFPSIATPDGPRPGFEIEGITSDGELLIKTDYVPAIGWNAHFWLYDLNTPDDPEDYLFHTMSMGHGKNWTGTYYVSTSKELLQVESVVGANPDDPAGSVVEPSPYNSFTVGEAATYQYGFIFTGGFTSQTEVVLVDPNNEHHQYETQIQPMAFGMNFAWIDEPAIPGQWHAVMGGAGMVSFAGVYLWEITEQSFTM